MAHPRLLFWVRLDMHCVDIGNRIENAQKRLWEQARASIFTPKFISLKMWRTFYFTTKGCFRKNAVVIVNAEKNTGQNTKK